MDALVLVRFTSRMSNKHPNLVKLGKRIRACRKSKGYSQEAFASEADIDRAYMGRIERGEQNLSTLNIIKIAKALKVEVGELFPPIRHLS